MLRRQDLYGEPIVDGRRLRDNFLLRLRNRMRQALISPLERQELQLEAQLRNQPGPSRPNTVAVISPKGGVGKTTTTFLVGTLMATHLRLPTLAVDLNPDFGTLANLAPDDVRVDNTMIELLQDREQIRSGAELRPYVSRLPSGLHLLAAPTHAEVISQMNPALYGELLDFLSPYYSVIMFDLGTGVAGEIAQFALARADQSIVLTTPEWVTAASVIGALRYLELEHATLVLNQASGSGHAENLERHFGRHRLARNVVIPYDEQLRTMLDSGTYSLPALRRATRVPVKQLGLSVAQQLV